MQFTITSLMQTKFKKKHKTRNKQKTNKTKEKKEYNTGNSQVISYPSTTPACSCLTSEIGRDPVFSTEYGRTHSTIAQGLSFI